MADKPEDQPVTPDSLLEVEPGIFKPLKDCTKDELLHAALVYMATVESEMQQEVDRLTSGDTGESLTPR